MPKLLPMVSYALSNSAQWPLYLWSMSLLPWHRYLHLYWSPMADAPLTPVSMIALCVLMQLLAFVWGLAVANSPTRHYFIYKMEYYIIVEDYSSLPVLISDWIFTVSIVYYVGAMCFTTLAVARKLLQYRKVIATLNDVDRYEENKEMVTKFIVQGALPVVIALAYFFLDITSSSTWQLVSRAMATGAMAYTMVAVYLLLVSDPLLCIIVLKQYKRAIGI